MQVVAGKRGSGKTSVLFENLFLTMLANMKIGEFKTNYCVLVSDVDPSTLRSSFLNFAKTNMLKGDLYSHIEYSTLKWMADDSIDFISPQMFMKGFKMNKSQGRVPYFFFDDVPAILNAMVASKYSGKDGVVAVSIDSLYDWREAKDNTNLRNIRLSNEQSDIQFDDSGKPYIELKTRVWIADEKPKDNSGTSEMEKFPMTFKEFQKFFREE